MKTDEITITQTPEAIADTLDKVELIAQYAGMPRRAATSTRLMAEELLSATKNILEAYEGRLWMETGDEAFTLHLRVKKPVDKAEREKLVALSKTGAVTPPKGLFSRLGAALEKYLLLEDGEPGAIPLIDCGMFSEGTPGLGPLYVYHYLPWKWEQPQKEKPADELEGIEKSIIDAIVDDILVTIQAGNVEIIAVKNLNQRKTERNETYEN